MLTRAEFFGGLSGAALAGSAAAAGAETLIRLTGFGNESNLPVWVAQDRGFFRREGLNVTSAATRGSIAQFKDVMAGRYDVVLTAIDNIVAYTEGQADVRLPDFDVVAFMGGDSGLNTLVTRPEIKTYADIRGKTVVVDALTTGYAFLLFRLLENHGLKPHKDYGVIGIGTGSLRLKAMLDGRAVAAVMSSTDGLHAKAMGFNILADRAHALGGRYQSSVYGVRRSWAKDHGPQLVGLVRAVRKANDYIFSDHAGALAILKRHLTKLSDTDAQITFESLVSGHGGLIRSAALSIPGIEMVLSMRNEFAVPKKTLRNPYKYLDLSYYDEATRT